MLEQSDIAHYLLSLSVVKPQTVLDEDLKVVDASRRNCVFLASTRSGPTFVIKQPVRGDGSPLAREAAVLERLAGVPALVPYIPAVVHQDRACLVLRTPGEARDWNDHKGHFPRIPARLLGRVLAALHQVPGDPSDVSDPIWGLELLEPPYDLILELSAGAQDVVRRIQTSDFVPERLVELREARFNGALAHGDLRWDNCLSLAAPGARRRTRVLLVDWELAGPSDPAFDVASVLAEYLRVWVGSVPIVEESEPGRLADHARHPLWAMRPAIRDLWSAYRSSHPQPPALRRVVELCAVRLLQTAIERAQGLNWPSAHVITLVQLAENMLRRPEDTAFALLGLRG